MNAFQLRACSPYQDTDVDGRPEAASSALAPYTCPTSTIHLLQRYSHYRAAFFFWWYSASFATTLLYLSLAPLIDSLHALICEIASSICCCDLSSLSILSFDRDSSIESLGSLFSISIFCISASLMLSLRASRLVRRSSMQVTSFLRNPESDAFDAIVLQTTPM